METKKKPFDKDEPVQLPLYGPGILALARGIIESGTVKNHSCRSLVRKISPHITTRNNRKISAESVLTKSGKISPKVKAEVRALLMNILHSIRLF